MRDILDYLAIMWPILLIALALIALVVFVYRGLELQVKSLRWMGYILVEQRELNEVISRYMAYDLDQRERLYTANAEEFKRRMEDPEFLRETVEEMMRERISVEIEAVGRGKQEGDPPAEDPRRVWERPTEVHPALA